jgi:protein gp37
MKVAHRLQHNPDPNVAGKYAGLTEKVNGRPVWTGVVRLWPPTLAMPLKRRKPTSYFVDSQSDLFHEALPDADIDRVFAVMARCPRHTFQILTKRADRLRAYFADPDARRAAWAAHADAATVAARGWPLPNVWLGVSVDDQPRADARIPALLATPAAVRFLSCEPLLGPVDLTRVATPPRDALRPGADDGRRLHWVIAGGESGPDARPMHPDWARALRDQCAAAGVGFFLKQWGTWAPADEPATRRETRWVAPDGGTGPRAAATPGAACMARAGKRAAGRTLDGRTWDGVPAHDDDSTGAGDGSTKSA